jgi:predicted nucleotidyltransferase component of viral defense system
MLTPHAITRRAEDDDVDAAVAERDYVLAHIVAHLHRVSLGEKGRLVFKGGTALRLLYVGETYRYSADLDFSILDGTAKGALRALSDVLSATKDECELPHLQLTAASKPAVAYIGPLGARKPRSIKLDLATDECVESVTQAAILPVWSDLPEPMALDVYSLDDIGAEKLRCVIQRVQCRDLYDLFRMTSDLGLSISNVRPLFERKTIAKNLDPSKFPERFIDRVDGDPRRWD